MCPISTTAHPCQRDIILLLVVLIETQKKIRMEMNNIRTKKMVQKDNLSMNQYEWTCKSRH